MATDVINIKDKGFGKIIDKKGHPMTVNVFAFTVVTNEAAPEIILCYCDPIYHDSILKNLQRLMWAKSRPPKEVKVQRCRECGCTEDDCSQCIEKTGAPCHWVEEDLCSACTGIKLEDAG